MPICPECETALDFDEEEIEEGDVVVCDECGTEYEVVATEPLELSKVEEGYEDEEELRRRGRRMRRRACGFIFAAIIRAGGALCGLRRLLAGRAAGVCVRLARGQDEFGLKNLQGKVLNAQDATISGARSSICRTRATTTSRHSSPRDDGSYRFAGLSVGYGLHGVGGIPREEEPIRPVSSFDTRKIMYLI